MTRIPPPQRDQFAKFEMHTTRWFDNDTYGHMNNTIHYQLMDTTVNNFHLSQGLLDMTKSETVFLVVQSGCSYFSELKFPGTIHAGLRIAHLGSSSIQFEVGLFQDDAPLASALGHLTHVQVNRDTHAPIALDETARNTLSQLKIDARKNTDV